MFNALATIYVAGVIVGLLVMRDRWTERLVTAALWPLGVVALAVVTIILVTASMYLWPILGVAFAIAAFGLWLML